MAEINILENDNTLQQHPMIPSRGIVVFPGAAVTLDVVRDFSVNAVHAAAKNNGLIIIASQRDFNIEDPNTKDLCDVATLAKIKQVAKLPDGAVRIVVRGLARCDLLKVEKRTKLFLGVVFPIDAIEASADSTDREALLRSLKEAFENYASLLPKFGEERMPEIFTESDMGRCADEIAAQSLLRPDYKQEILETLDPVKRCEALLEILIREIEVLKMEQEIHARVRESIEANQRDYYLHEQMRVIQDELGENENGDDIDGYYQKVEALKASDEIKAKLIKEVDRMAKMPPLSHEGAVIRNYLDLVLELRTDHGYELVQALRQSGNRKPVIMLTAMNSFEHKRQGFASGIDDYMTKPIDYEELVWRIEAILRRANIANEKKIQIGRFEMNQGSYMVTYDGKDITLTNKEFDLLFLLLSYPESIYQATADG